MTLRSPSRALLLVTLLATPANELRAHWCDDNWESAYNIVVRPERDSIDVPESGTAQLRVWVQNNMTYPLYNFRLTAQASGYSIPDPSTTGAKRSGWLMPGEKLLHIFQISRSGGAPTMYVEDMELFVGFGDNQDGRYGEGTGRDVMVKKTDGSLYPARPVGNLPQLNNDQGLHLRAAAVTDFGDAAEGIDTLLWDFCVGRVAWDGSTANTSYCPDQSTTNCPDANTWANLGGEPYAYLYMHLLSAGELAARRSALSPAQLTLFRQRLMCAAQDPHPSMKAFILFVLGYLGADTTAQGYLDDIVANGAPEEVCMARAALLMMGQGQHEAEVRACLDLGNEFAEMASGAALGVALADDQAVEDELFARVEWIIFESNHSGVMSGVYANLVAWHQRGWQANAGDVGSVSFYEDTPPDTVAPRAPANPACSVVGGNLRLTWSQVVEDEEGNPETVPSYNVYWGTTARPGGATRPGEAGFDYDHRDPRSAAWFEPTGLSAGQTYYFGVTALDTRANESVYSAEVSCTAPDQALPPDAVLACSPTDGDAPLEVSCDASGSSDPNGAGTIASVVITAQGQDYASTTMTHTFANPGTYTVLLTVTDNTGRADTDEQVITVRDPSGSNVPPVAVASADVTSGYLPLDVSFTSTGSSDSDGTIVGWAWDFGDGGSSTEANPAHTFTVAGSYDVLLTVTDDGTPPLSGVDYVTVTVVENQPPDLSAASASPLFGEVPLDVTFDASGVYDPDYDAFTIAWAFGDGASSASPTVTHTYSVEGSFTATLTGTDAFGASASRDFVVNAGAAASNLPPDLSSATVTPLGGEAPLTVQVDASGISDPEGDNLAIEWVMSTGLAQTEGEILTEAVASYTFNEPGAFSATLRVTDDGTPPMQSTRRFDISVLEAGAEGDGGAAAGALVGEGCACNARGASSLAALPALLLAARWRRRRARLLR